MHKAKLAAALEIHAFNRDIDDIDDRINEKAVAVSTDDLGKDLAGVQALQRKQEEVERDMTALQAQLEVRFLFTIVFLVFVVYGYFLIFMNCGCHHPKDYICAKYKASIFYAPALKCHLHIHVMCMFNSSSKIVLVSWQRDCMVPKFACL